ncbi:MAG: M20/M25/M40 family metallo-hydrolase, partial [Candidatus Bathyarchaeia archaeon]
MLAKELIKIPSVNPPGDEKEVSELLASHMEKIGLTVELEEIFPNRSNVIATLEGIEGGPTLLFLGHTDVVPVDSGWSIDPFKAIEKEGKLFGRGSADMKGGLAAMVIAIESLKRSKVTLRGNLIFAAVIDEEVSSYGIRHLIENGLKADYAIIGEPTDLKM